MKETTITRISAGVMFESDVLLFIDRLAAEQQRHRSFIINRIIRYYSRMTEGRPDGLPADGGQEALKIKSPAASDVIRF